MNVELLREKYKSIKVRNRRNIVTTIPLGNGTEVFLNPRQNGVVLTAHLTQIPDPRQVTLVSPSLADLMADGILSVGDTVGGEGEGP